MPSYKNLGGDPNSIEKYLDEQNENAKRMIVDTVKSLNPFSQTPAPNTERPKSKPMKAPMRQQDIVGSGEYGDISRDEMMPTQKAQAPTEKLDAYKEYLNKLNSLMDSSDRSESAQAVSPQPKELEESETFKKLQEQDPRLKNPENLKKLKDYLEKIKQ